MVPSLAEKRQRVGRWIANSAAGVIAAAGWAHILNVARACIFAIAARPRAKESNIDLSKQNTLTLTQAGRRPSNSKSIENPIQCSRKFCTGLNQGSNSKIAQSCKFVFQLCLLHEMAKYEDLAIVAVAAIPETRERRPSWPFGSFSVNNNKPDARRAFATHTQKQQENKASRADKAFPETETVLCHSAAAAAYSC